MMQMPKIIPLELVTEVPQKLTIEENNEEEDSEIKFESLKIDLSPKKKLGTDEREEMTVDESDNEQKLEDYEVYENEVSFKKILFGLFFDSWKGLLCRKLFFTLNRFIFSAV
ncbi:hypothetical protein ACQ4LE_004902 [Meloidogyne hapla]